MSKLCRLVLSSCLVFAAACGGSQKPNPLPSEEPMDKSGGSADSTPTTTAASTDPGDSTSSSSADPSAGLSASDPAATPAAPPPSSDPGATDPKGKGKGKGKGAKAGKGGELSSSECQQLSNKGVDLLVAGMGMSDPSMVAQIKAQAAGDPNFASMQTECVKSTTRAQYKCGMAATSKDAWEACLK